MRGIFNDISCYLVGSNDKCTENTQEITTTDDDVFDGIIQESDQLTPIGRRKYKDTKKLKHLVTSKRKPKPASVGFIVIGLGKFNELYCSSARSIKLHCIDII
jgi:hypothetical protein